jgi:hypothetical protein
MFRLSTSQRVRLAASQFENQNRLKLRSLPVSGPMHRPVSGPMHHFEWADVPHGERTGAPRDADEAAPSEVKFGRGFFSN